MAGHCSINTPGHLGHHPPRLIQLCKDLFFCSKYQSYFAENNPIGGGIDRPGRSLLSTNSNRFEVVWFTNRCRLVLCNSFCPINRMYSFRWRRWFRLLRSGKKKNFNHQTTNNWTKHYIVWEFSNWHGRARCVELIRMGSLSVWYCAAVCSGESRI